MLDKIIKAWLKDTEKALIRNYRRLGLRASGRWEKELETKQTNQGAKYTAAIEGMNYTQWIENGRGPNSDQSEEGLRSWVGWAGSTFLAKWVQEKGINANPFAVAWKIAREGWTVPNKHNKGGLVSDVVTKDRIQKLLDNFQDSYVYDLRSTIIKTLR
jgi:hypothetical protein